MTHHPSRHCGRGGGGDGAACAGAVCRPRRLRLVEVSAWRGVSTLGARRFPPALRGPVSGAIALPTQLPRLHALYAVGEGVVRLDAPIVALIRGGGGGGELAPHLPCGQCKQSEIVGWELPTDIYVQLNLPGCMCVNYRVTSRLTCKQKLLPQRPRLIGS